MSDRYEALSEEEIQSKDIHRAHFFHALASLWLFVLVAIAGIVWEIIIYFANPNIWLISIGTGFVALLFIVALMAWHGGRRHIDAQAEEYQLDKRHQREMELKQQRAQARLEELRYRAMTVQPVQKQLPSEYNFGMDLANPSGATIKRIDSIPSEEFIVWLWTEGFNLIREEPVVKSETEVQARWGDKVPWDVWLAELAKVSLITGRSREKRKGGVLAVELYGKGGALDYFHYGSPLP